MKKIAALLVVATIFANACKKDKPPPTAPTVTTSALTNITTTSATAGGTITGNGGADITASGIVLSRKNTTPTLSDTVMSATATTGSFTVALTNLEFGTAYYIRAFATNSVGTSYGDPVTLNTANDTSKVRFDYMGKTVTYGIIVSSVTKKKWLDRNLGASGVATSLTDTAGYGHYFQWGRLSDGHQLKSSGTTTTPSSSDVPGHSNFIYGNFATTGLGFGDWRIPQNNNLWQGSSGVNNPCPTGWHIPTKGEWDAETGIKDPSTAFSQLKLPLAGYRSGYDATISAYDTQGQYWSSSSDDLGFGGSYLMSVFSGNTGTSLYARSHGLSIRCIKD